MAQSPHSTTEVPLFFSHCTYALAARRGVPSCSSAGEGFRPSGTDMSNQSAISKEQAALLKEHAMAPREHGALVEKAVGQVDEACHVLGLATFVIQPIDMVKVMIQLGEGTAGQIAKNMLANDGIHSFYRGFTAGIVRQVTYSAARIGSFSVLTKSAVEKSEGKPLPLIQKACIGLTAGAVGAFVASPADLALIRMQANSTLPAARRRDYKNAFHALYRITTDEGVLALWKGAGPTVARAMALNMGMLASYYQSVELFRDKFGAGEVSTVIGASAVSGFFASAFSLPFDFVKTQIQKMRPDAQGKYQYTGSLDCASVR